MRGPPVPKPHVVDQGPGMSDADRERAFDRFWRSSDSHHDGTGLGLPIVRHLVDASGGTITLHPAPGTGLDARIHLRPVAPIPRGWRSAGEDFGSRAPLDHRTPTGRGG
ncbi:sensor histidine kinase [Streptomyces sp. WSLK1-3]|uniref:sensor histidine kinase n=1 Tax=Streptomyces sp. WSLK1-3 TaxID=3375475 RepID=UPI00379EA793